MGAGCCGTFSGSIFEFVCKEKLSAVLFTLLVSPFLFLFSYVKIIQINKKQYIKYVEYIIILFYFILLDFILIHF